MVFKESGRVYRVDTFTAIQAYCKCITVKFINAKTTFDRNNMIIIMAKGL